MTEKIIKKKPQLFNENPYDIETVFETLSIASNNEKELLYMDKLISTLRKNPQIDLTELNYTLLIELNIMK